MGLPTVAMGLLGLVIPPVQAAALLVVPSLVTNVWQLVAGPRFTNGAGGQLRVTPFLIRSLMDYAALLGDVGSVLPVSRFSMAM
jgi:hypothetical protein